MKCLAFIESPAIETGSGQVSKQMLQVFRELGWDTTIVAQNHIVGFNYDREKIPEKIYHSPPGNDLISHYNLNTLTQCLQYDDFDVFFAMGDVQVLYSIVAAVKEAVARRAFKTVFCVAVDTEFMPPHFGEAFTFADITVTWTKYGKEVAERYCTPIRPIEVIGLGCEPDVFYPLEQEEKLHYKRKFFQKEGKTYMAINVNRNQFRKDIPRSIAAFLQFHENHPNSAMYIHAREQDLGGNLSEQAKYLGATEGVVMLGPKELTEVTGCPRDELNRIYNTANVFISSATGEGWGLTTTEAMCAGIPVIVPHNTSNPEIVGEHQERGWLASSGGDELWHIHYGVTDGPRPMTSVRHLHQLLEYVYEHPEEAQEKADEARTWCLGHTWEKVRAQWIELLAKSI